MADGNAAFRDTYLAELGRCRGWIESALPYCHGNYEWDDVVTFCLDGRMQLWPGERSAAVTTISQYPRRKGLTVIFAGGDLEELRAVLAPQIEDWARTIGCDHITVIGRAGWVRALGTGEIVATMASKEL